MIARRKFIALCCVLAASVFTAGHSLRKQGGASSNSVKFVGPPEPDELTARAIEKKPYSTPIADLHSDHIIADNLSTNTAAAVIEPPTDIILSDSEKLIFDLVIGRLSRLQSYVGYGNFNVISWDRSLRIARSRDQVGAFTKLELDFIENLFFTNAGTLGFYGDKVVTRLSSTIPKRSIVKIPATGHYLFKGKAADTYQKIRKDVGDSIVLTSGIRSVVKQIFLFLNKAAKVNGNLSLASYSLAPPGHSFHALGDFDVGKKGFGRKNFTAKFADTDEFKRLSDLGYLDIRYPQNNPYGVRYEPWHIKVV